jgi:probable F420-dependent oxidoreductase
MPARPFRFSVTTSGVNDPVALAELAQRCEELGYDTLAISDHLDDQLGPLVALAYLASQTTSLKLLPLVLANDFRHPAVLAKEIATLDLISDGRVEMGIGAGWMASDYATAGIGLDAPSVRIERLEESLNILRRLFAGEVVDFQGDHYQIAGLAGSPMPAQGARLPIMVAGGRQKVLSVAGRHADIVGLNPGLGAGVIDHRAGPSATAEATDEKVGWVRAAAGGRSDEIELHTRIHVAVITDDRESLAEAIAPTLGVTATAALESPHAVAGTVDQCVETILGWRERWGISYIGFSADVVDDFAPVVARLKSVG